ncbi:MAG: hypothetical protein KBE16_05455 [Alphaproteobacteria bacterium]|jgi:hypothetical protein|nr:hypothetical protein [Alphaproteobacteria bacterium]MBP9878394.1 hypothetical protein [Alphaproteobacteria bacterium]
MAHIQNTCTEIRVTPEKLAIWEGVQVSVSLDSLQRRYLESENDWFTTYSTFLFPFLTPETLLTLRLVSKNCFHLVNTFLMSLREQLLLKVQAENVVLNLWADEQEGCILKNDFFHRLTELGLFQFFTVKSIEQYYVSEIDQNLFFGGLSDLSANADWPPYKDGHLITANSLIKTHMIRRLPFLEKTVVRLNHPLEIVELDTHFSAMPWISNLVMQDCQGPLLTVSESQFVKNFSHAGITLYAERFVNVLLKCTNLKQLVIKDDVFLPDHLDALQPNSMPNLQKLVIATKFLTTALFQQILRAAPKLESLYIGEPVLLGGHLFADLAPGSLPKLFQFWVKGWQESEGERDALSQAAPLFTNSRLEREVEESGVLHCYIRF